MICQACGLDKKKALFSQCFFLAERVGCKLNVASPALIDLKLKECNPPEIKPLDKLEFDYLVNSHL